MEPGLVSLACDTSTLEAKAEVRKLKGILGVRIESLSQKKRKKRKGRKKRKREGGMCCHQYIPIPISPVFER